MRDKRCVAFGALCVFLCIYTGNAAQACMLWPRNSDLLTFAIERNDAGEIMACCRKERCADDDLFRALEWALKHDDDAGINVIEAIIQHANTSPDTINYGLDKAIREDKRASIEILVTSSKAQEKSLCKAFRWIILNEENNVHGGKVARIILQNPSISQMCIRTCLAQAIVKNRAEIIKLLVVAVNEDKGKLLYAFDWAISNAENDYGVVVAQAILDNPTFDADLVVIGFYEALRAKKCNIIGLIAASQKTNAEELNEALIWAFEHETIAGAMEVVRIIIANPQTRANSLQIGFYHVVRKLDLSIIRILAANRRIGSYSLWFELSYLIALAGFDNDEIIKVFLKNPNMLQDDIKKAFYLAIDHEKRQIVKAFITSGRLGKAELRRASLWAEKRHYSDISAICQARVKSAMLDKEAAS